ncbi:MAG: SDR family oxidoreductase [Rhodoferax sp.]|nr:SDR family oxidoreductase [Rhodoferax sp.]MDP3650203.1 SDR family oxidoreductase [Rhodoferax sp.]
MTHPPRALPTALVTGASSGIGQSLAECFAGAGHNLVLVARSADKLQALAETLQARHGVQVWVEPADLARPDAAATLSATLQQQGRAVDVLVNCAGVLEQSAFATMTPAQHQQIIDLNISGLTAMLAHFVAPMVQRGQGRVLNVASIAAFQPVPTLATYAASKAYVLSLSESLAEELKGSGVTVTTLCPGITATPMLTSAKDANAKMSQIPGFLIGAVDDVARLGFEACMKGDAICVPGALNRAAMIASRGTPKWLVRRIGGVLGRKAV